MTTDIPVAAFIRKVAGLDRQKAIRHFPTKAAQVAQFVLHDAITAA
ncbi:MAG: hypothetical protein HDS39_00830 [Bacteroides sp.]|nr:hypothetical protein [Bacteroides sp.]